MRLDWLLIDFNEISHNYCNFLQGRKILIDKTHYLWYDVFMQEITTDINTGEEGEQSMFVQAIMAFVFGGFFFVLPIYLLLWERNVKKNGVEIDAEITKIEKHQGDDRVSYTITVTYVIGIKTYETSEFPGLTSLEDKAVGNIVRIRYRKDNPNKIVALDGKKTGQYIVLGIMSLVGLGLIIFGVFFT